MCLSFFLCLWITGLLVVSVDTGFQISLILSNSKVLIKFVSVLVLTLNGLALHMWGLKMLALTDRMSRSQAIVLCIMGALSTTNWLLAGFIGSADLLTAFSFQSLVLSYIVITVVACACGYLSSGIVQKRMNFHRSRAAVKALGIDPALGSASFLFRLPSRQAVIERINSQKTTRTQCYSHLAVTSTSQADTKTYAAPYCPVVN